MPEKGYFSKMGLYAFTGIIALTVAAVVLIGLALVLAPVGALLFAAMAGVVVAITIVVLIFFVIFG
ncbi:MAG: hypothetical protein ABIH90_02930, partial [Candidatus Aenigmatarchaeota archaeon]